MTRGKRWLREYPGTPDIIPAPASIVVGHFSAEVCE
jgi:hypothetical protein